MNQPKDGKTEQQRKADALLEYERTILAAKRKLRLKKASEDLIDFTCLMMPDPNDPDDANKSRYQPAKHHKVIAKALEEVDKGNILRLIITMPPRAGKSELSSKKFIPWLLGRDPYKHVIFASYNETFAQDTGRAVRDLMKLNLYRQVFPGCELRAGSAAADRVQTQEGGIAAFVGAGGSITGRGADCVTGDTLIDTEIGRLTIKQLCGMASPPRVVSINTTNNEIEYRRIVASIARRSTETFKITFASGAMVEVTGNHPFICAGKFIKGSAIAAGDRVLRLVQQGNDYSSEEISRKRSSWIKAFLLRAKSCVDAQKSNKSTKRKEGNLSSQRRRMSNLQCSVQGCMEGEKVGKARNLLLQVLRGARAFSAYVWKGESKMEAWSNPIKRAASFGKGFQANEKIDTRTRQSFLRDLQKIKNGNQAGGASHRQLADEQRRVESCDIVQPPSQSCAWGLGFKTEEDTVSLVERVCDETVVYDIEVEETHTFFANGIACLNCLIIDDPIKDREQADSTTERNKLWSWFTEVAMTRLMTAGSRVVIIMTRWHEDDLIGRLTDPTNPCYNKDEAKSWKILALPAIAEDDDPMGRKRGESLWPERFPIEFLQNARRLNPRGFSALYQGRPTPDDGEFFKKDYLKTYGPDDLPSNLRYYCASDHAVSTKQDRDPTVLLPVGVCEDGIIWVLPDAWWRREQTDKVVEAMLAMMKRRKPLFWWAENGHISKSIGPFLRKRMVEESIYASVIEMTPVKDKMTRAQSIQAMASLGRVRFPRFAPWWPNAEQELLKFPAGRHDDFVDALAWIGIGLNLQTNAPAPAKMADLIKTGTLAWVKHQTRQEEKMKRLAYRDGF